MQAALSRAPRRKAGPIGRGATLGAEGPRRSDGDAALSARVRRPRSERRRRAPCRDRVPARFVDPLRDGHLDPRVCDPRSGRLQESRRPGVHRRARDLLRHPDAGAPCRRSRGRAPAPALGSHKRRGDGRRGARARGGRFDRLGREPTRGPRRARSARSAGAPPLHRDTGSHSDGDGPVDHRQRCARRRYRAHGHLGDRPPCLLRRARVDRVCQSDSPGEAVRGSPARRRRRTEWLRPRRERGQIDGRGRRAGPVGDEQRGDLDGLREDVPRGPGRRRYGHGREGHLPRQRRDRA